MSNLLKKCPFCNVELENEPPSTYFIHPQNGCFLSKLGISITDTERVNQWNTRYIHWASADEGLPNDTDLYLVKRERKYDLLLFNSSNHLRSTYPENRNKFIELDRHREWTYVDDVTHWAQFSSPFEEDDS